MNKVAVSIADVVSMTGLSEASVYRLLKRGTLRSVKVGRRRLIPTEAVNALLKA